MSLVVAAAAVVVDIDDDDDDDACMNVAGVDAMDGFDSRMSSLVVSCDDGLVSLALDWILLHGSSWQK